MTERDLEIKTQLLDIIQKIGLAQTPQNLIDALQEAKVIKNATRSSIILFNPALPEQQAIVVATLDSRPNALNLINTVYTPQTVPLFWQAPTNQPFVVDDINTDPRLNEHNRQILNKLEVKSFVGLALNGANGHLGWLMVENHERVVYAEADIQFLIQLTQFIGITLQNYLLLQKEQANISQLKEERDALENLFGITTRFEQAQNIDDILTILVEFTPNVKAGDGLAYLIEDSGHEYFNCSTTFHIPAEFFQQAHALLAKTNNNCLLVDNIADEPAWANLFKLTPQFQPASLLLIRLGHSPVSGYIMFSHETAHHFKTQHIQLAQTVGSQTMAALRNILLLQDTQTSLNDSQILLGANQEIFAATNTNEVYNIIVKAFIDFGADRCTLGAYTEYRSDGFPLKSKIAAIAGSANISPRLNLKEQIGQPYNLPEYPYLSSVLQTKRLFTINNVNQDPNLSENEREYLTKIKTQALALIPLASLTTGEALGYIFVEHLTPHQFSQRELALYQTMGNQAAMAISNAQYLAKTQERALQIQTGAEISKITSSILNENTLIEQAVNLIKSGFDLYYVGLFLVDADNKWAVLKAGSGSEGAAQIALNHRLPLDEKSMIGWSILNQKARIAYDVGEDAVHFNNPHLPLTRSEMALPLISRKKVLGALTIQSTAPAAFSHDNIATLQIMADQLANAILNSQQYQTIHTSAHELSTLLEINHDLSASTDLAELLELIVGRATAVVKGDQGTIFLLEDDILIPHAVTGGFEDEIMAITVQMGEGASGTAAQTRRSVVRHIEAPDETEQIPGTPVVPESLVAVPIQTEESLIGVLLIRRLSTNHKFSSAEVKLLEGMASQAAIAVKNAHLLNATQNARLQTERLYTLSRSLAGVESTSAAGNIAVQYVAQHAYDRALVSLKDDPDDPKNTWVENIAVWDVDGNQDNYLHNRFSASEIPLMNKVNQEEVLAISDFNEHPLVDERTKMLFTQILGVKSALILPIKAGHKVLGWLLAETTHQPRAFTEADISSLQAVTDQLGGALDRIQKTASLIAAGEQYLSMVESIPGAVYRGKFSDRYQFVYLSDDMEKITGYELERFLKEDGLSLPDIIHPDDVARVRATVTQQLQKRQAYQMQYRIINKAGQIRHLSERGRGIFAPDGSVQYVDGVIFDVTERVSLAEAVQRRATQFEAIAQVGQNASAILDVDQLLAETVELISNHFGFYYAAIFLLDEANEWAILKAGSGKAGQNMLAENHRLRRDEKSMVGWATYHGTPHVALDVEEERHRYNNPHLPETRSEIALPLITRGKVIGALDVQSVEEYAFSNEDIATLQLMANQLANVIENARLFEETQNSLHQANLIYQTTQKLLVAKTEAELFRIFVETVGQVGVDTISVNLYGGSEDDRYFEMKEVWDREGNTVYPIGSRFKIADNLLSQIFYQNQTVLIQDTRTDPRLDNPPGKQVLEAGVYSLIGVPILLYDKSEGVVVISSKQPDKTFDQSEVRFFESMVQQLTITWQNLSLLTSIERRFRRERIIRQVTSKIHAASGIENILRTTVTELAQALDTPGGAIKLGNGQHLNKLQVPAAIPEIKQPDNSA